MSRAVRGAPPTTGACRSPPGAGRSDGEVGGVRAARTPADPPPVPGCSPGCTHRVGGLVRLVGQGLPAMTPFHQWLQRPDEIDAPLGEPVPDLHRRRWHDLTLDELRGLQLTHSLRQHPVGQTRYLGTDFAEPGRTAGQRQQDRRTPPLTDEFDGGLEMPALVVVDELPGSLHLLIVSPL